MSITKHNLSSSGPGIFRAQSETEICKFCHTPHNSNPTRPLWSHRLSAVANYINYWSPSLDAYPSEAAAPEPDGDSKLCLSCHDGTIALGDVVVELAPIPFVGSDQLQPGDSGYVGTDLSGSHPISFIVTDALIAQNNLKDSPLRPLAAMQSDPDVHLDSQNKLQCSSCHNVHDDSKFAISGIRFWTKNSFSETCLVCHNM